MRRGASVTHLPPQCHVVADGAPPVSHDRPKVGQRPGMGLFTRSDLTIGAYTMFGGI